MWVLDESSQRPRLETVKTPLSLGSGRDIVRPGGILNGGLSRTY